MAGLFEKDIRLILRNKQMVIVVAFMALMMSFREVLIWFCHI